MVDANMAFADDMAQVKMEEIDNFHTSFYC